LHLGPPSDREDGLPRNVPSQPLPSERDDLPYKVEIWNDTGASVEQIVAVTANASIGYAISHCATRAASSLGGAGRSINYLHCRDRRREPR